MSMPVLYLGHGAPTLLEDVTWTQQLGQWGRALPRPTGILIVSAHWEAAPIALSNPAANAPLVYDFSGFDPHYLTLQYPTPDATALAAAVIACLAPHTSVHTSSRGLDHGAWVPLRVMFPAHDIPTLQLSMPTKNPEELRMLGARLSPLRDAGVLIITSGFLTHGLRFLNWGAGVAQTPPSWSADFDAWAADAIDRGDFDALANYRTAPGMPYAHPTVEHFTPLFMALGAGDDATPRTVIDGYWLGLAKRSIEIP